MTLLFIVKPKTSVAQSVMCLTADTCLTVDPEVACLILARAHTVVEIDNEIFLWPFSSLPLIQEGLLSVKRKRLCKKYRSTVKSSLPRKKCGKVN